MRKLKLVVLVLLILLSTSAIASQPKIYLAGGEIAPEASQQSRGLTTQSLNQQPSYKLLQFKQPTTKEQREELEGLGVEYISYIPDNAWIIRFSGQRNEILREEKVHYLGAYRPGYRIEPQLKKEAARNSGEVLIRVEMFESEGAEELLDSYGEVKDK